MEGLPTPRVAAARFGWEVSAVLLGTLVVLHVAEAGLVIVALVDAQPATADRVAGARGTFDGLLLAVFLVHGAQACGAELLAGAASAGA